MRDQHLGDRGGGHHRREERRTLVREDEHCWLPFSSAASATRAASTEYGAKLTKAVVLSRSPWSPVEPRGSP